MSNKTDGIIIIVGRSYSGKGELFNELCAKGCEGVRAASTSTAINSKYNITTSESFVKDIDQYVGIGALDGEFYGVKERDILTGGTTKVVVLPPSSARAIYGWAIQNNITPFLVKANIRDDERLANILKSGERESPTVFSKRLDEKILDEMDRMDIPVGAEIINNKKGIADSILDRFTLVQKYSTTSFECKAAREKNIKKENVRSLLSRLDVNSKALGTYQKIAAVGAAVAIFSAGSQEMAVALFGTFWLARESIDKINFNSEMFKEAGFNFADRISYFLASGFVNDDEKCDVKSKDDLERFILAAKRNALVDVALPLNESFLSKTIGVIEDKFSKVFITAAGMKSLSDNFTEMVLSELSPVETEKPLFDKEMSLGAHKPLASMAV
jgi:hypothetical protein